MAKEKFCTFFKIWWANLRPTILLNIVYSAMTLLLLPSGLAAVGMANVAGNLARERYFFSFREFWSAIKKSWKQALVAGLINAAFTAALVLVFWFYLSSSGVMFVFGLGCCLLSTVVFSFMNYYLWIQIAMFRLPLFSAYKNAFIFAFLNLKTNLLIGIVSMLCYALAAVVLLYVPYLVAVVVVAVLGTCLFPIFKQLLIQYLIFPFLKAYMIDPYYAEHSDEDIRERSELGIET